MEAAYYTAIVIYGDTKPYKEDIKAIGGRWDPYLKNGPGWIVPAEHLNDVLDLGIDQIKASRPIAPSVSKPQSKSVQVSTVAENGADDLNEIRAIYYTPKSIAVIGNSKPYKNELKAIGGTWNSRLKIGKGGGWIFRRSKEDQIKQVLGLTKIDERDAPSTSSVRTPTSKPSTRPAKSSKRENPDYTFIDEEPAKTYFKTLVGLYDYKKAPLDERDASYLGGWKVVNAIYDAKYLLVAWDIDKNIHLFGTQHHINKDRANKFEVNYLNAHVYGQPNVTTVQYKPRKKQLILTKGPNRGLELKDIYLNWDLPSLFDQKVDAPFLRTHMDIEPLLDAIGKDPHDKKDIVLVGGNRIEDISKYLELHNQVEGGMKDYDLNVKMVITDFKLEGGEYVFEMKIVPDLSKSSFVSEFTDGAVTIENKLHIEPLTLFYDPQINELNYQGGEIEGDPFDFIDYLTRSKWIIAFSKPSDVSLFKYLPEEDTPMTKNAK